MAGLGVEVLHLMLAIASTGYLGGGYDFLDCRLVFGGELYAQRRERLFELPARASAHDGDEVVAFCQNPGNGQLRGTGSLLPGEVVQGIDQALIAGAIFSAEAREVIAHISSLSWPGSAEQTA